MKLIPLAASLTSTRPGPGSGVATSDRVRTSGPPVSSIRIARMRVSLSEASVSRRVWLDDKDVAVDVGEQLPGAGLAEQPGQRAAGAVADDQQLRADGVGVLGDELTGAPVVGDRAQEVP